MLQILAQVSEITEVAWIGPLIQLVQFGGFTALAWFLLWKKIPEMERSWAAERATWISYLEKRDEKFEELLRASLKCIEEANARRTH